MTTIATDEQQLRIPSNPHIQQVWVPNAGHYLSHECPAEVVAVYVRCCAPSE